MANHSTPDTLEQIYAQVEAKSRAPLTEAETTDVHALHQLFNTRYGYVAVHAFGVLVDVRLNGKPNPASVILVGFAPDSVVRRTISLLEQYGFIESDEDAWRVTERGLMAHLNYHDGLIG